MKKRIVTALVAAALLVSQTAVFAQHDFDEYKERTEKIELFEQADENVELFETYGDFEYDVNSDDTVTITGYTGNATEITIPSEIDGKTVTTIDYCAFYACENLTSVTIPNSVTEIGSYVFYGCSSLESITIPDSVTEIEIYAFYGTALYENEENWENGVLYIGKHLIEAKNDIVGEYIIKDGTVTIVDSAFWDCSSLASITIPDSVTTIGDEAFCGCSSLASITIPDGVTYIGSSVFYGCSSLESITIGNSVRKIGYSAFLNCSRLTSVTIPNGVTTIGDDAFCGCSSLESITIPNSVTEIGYYAFWGCSSLTSVTIPNSVTEIGYSAFYGCDNLTIYGRSRSYAESYAKKYNIPFSAIKKSELSFDDISLNVSTPTYNDDEVTINISVSNNKQNSENFTLYAVGYSAGGAIVGIKQISVTDNNYSGNVEFDVSEKPVYVKVFAFDAVNGASPLCVAQETKLN